MKPKYIFGFNQNDMDRVELNGHVDILMKDGTWIRVALCNNDGDIIDKNIDEDV